MALRFLLKCLRHPGILGIVTATVLAIGFGRGIGGAVPAAGIVEDPVQQLHEAWDTKGISNDNEAEYAFGDIDFDKLISEEKTAPKQNTTADVSKPAEPADLGANQGGEKRQDAVVSGTSQGDKPAAEIVTHVVRWGETLSTIAHKYGTDVNTILANNEIKNINLIFPGQRLTIITVPGILHTVRRGDTLWALADQYDVAIGDIIAVNRLPNPGVLSVGQQLVIPGARKASVYAETWIWPVIGRISSRFGPRWGSFHTGLDIAAVTGTPIRASKSGKVVQSGVKGGYGLAVTLEHPDGSRTLYGHTSRLLVTVGEWVNQGQTIALVGNTGHSTGPHLHFEIQLNGKCVDPLPRLK